MEETIESGPEIKKKSKSWKKYVFDFFMLFLAVFMGFVAENLREDFVEKRQSRELAKSFYEELKNDSVTIATKVQGRIKKEKAIEYMISFFRDSALNVSSKELAINFEWATTVRTPIIFTPRTVIFEQLKNSGAKYFKSPQLQQLIGDLSVSIDYILARQEVEAFVYRQYIEPIVVSHMDFEFQNKLFKEGIFDQLAIYEANDEYIPFKLSQPEKINRQEYMNQLRYYQTNNIKSTRLVPFKSYIEANAALLSELRKEYELE